jgi:hypothetical protein
MIIGDSFCYIGVGVMFNNEDVVIKGRLTIDIIAN